MTRRTIRYVAALSLVCVLAGCAAPRVSAPAGDAAAETTDPKELVKANRPPVYPADSKREGQQGKVIVRVRIDADGRPTESSIRSSSGFKSLDNAAQEAVMSWRYVPGKRNGVPEPMWFNVPINFKLQ